jgi:hypothetical protein
MARYRICRGEAERGRAIKLARQPCARPRPFSSTTGMFCLDKKLDWFVEAMGVRALCGPILRGWTLEEAEAEQQPSGASASAPASGRDACSKYMVKDVLHRGSSVAASGQCGSYHHQDWPNRPPVESDCSRGPNQSQVIKDLCRSSSNCKDFRLLDTPDLRCQCLAGDP